MVEIIKDNDLSKALEKKVAVVDFSATWCGPCQMLAPVFDEVAEELDGTVSFYKVDVDENMDLARTYRVMSVPTILLFKDGEKVDQSIGLISAEELKAFIG